MLTVAEFYLGLGETGPPTDLERAFVQQQILVGEDAVRNYTRRYLSPMVWEDRFQRPNIIHLLEYPVTQLLMVIADGHTLPATDYYFYPDTGRLYRRVTDAPNWFPWGFNAWWGVEGTPDNLPEYYADWRGIGALIVLYKAGYDVMPAILKGVVSDYVYERTQLLRASKSSGTTTPIPSGTITGITIEGVGSIRYSGGATTTSSAFAARSSGMPVIGSAGPLLDAYREVANVVPGNRALISHRPALLLPLVEAPVLTYSDQPQDLLRYSDRPEDLLVYTDPAPGVMEAFYAAFPNSAYQPTTVLLAGSETWSPYWANIS